MEENMQGESSMDEKAFLLQEIRYSKRKQNVKKFLRYESTGIAAGGTIAMVLEGCAVFVPFYTVHVWAVLAVLCGAAAGGIYTVKKRPPARLRLGQAGEQQAEQLLRRDGKAPEQHGAEQCRHKDGPQHGKAAGIGVVLQFHGLNFRFL